MPLSTEIDLGPGHIKLDGTQLIKSDGTELHPDRGTAALFSFWPMSTVGKWSPISAIAELLSRGAHRI